MIQGVLRGGGKGRFRVYSVFRESGQPKEVLIENIVYPIGAFALWRVVE
jgi:hypothetical protein